MKVEKIAVIVYFTTINRISSNTRKNKLAPQVCLITVLFANYLILLAYRNDKQITYY